MYQTILGFGFIHHISKYSKVCRPSVKGRCARGALPGRSVSRGKTEIHRQKHLSTRDGAICNPLMECLLRHPHQHQYKKGQRIITGPVEQRHGLFPPERFGKLEGG